MDVFALEIKNDILQPWLSIGKPFVALMPAAFNAKTHLLLDLMPVSAPSPES